VYCGRMLPTASTTRRDLQWKLVFLAVETFNIKKYIPISDTSQTVYKMLTGLERDFNEY
jgi:hypothetical protein